MLKAGETVYQTAKSGRILRNGEVNGFIFTSGTSDLSTVNNILINCLGKTTVLDETTHFTVNSDNNVLINEDGRTKLRRFPFVLSTEDNTVLEYKATARDAGDATIAEGYGVVPTLKITNTITKTKSFYSRLDPTSLDQFTADVSTRNRIEGDLTEVANGATFRGDKDTNTLICESVSSDASDQLVSGDIIVFTDDAGDEIRKMVHFVTKPFSFSGNRQNCKIFLTTTLSGAVNGKVVERIRIKNSGTSSDPLIFQF